MMPRATSIAAKTTAIRDKTSPDPARGCQAARGGEEGQPAGSSGLRRHSASSPSSKEDRRFGGAAGPPMKSTTHHASFENGVRTRRLILAIVALATFPSVGLAGDVPCPTAVTPAPVPLELRDGDLVPAPQALRLGAFDIVIVPGPGLAAHPAAMDAFERAAREWEAYISDPITVTIEAEIAPMDSAWVIGQTRSVSRSADYDLVRDRIVAGAAADDGMFD